MLYGRNKLLIARNYPQEASIRPFEASETPKSLRRKSKNHQNDYFWASDLRNGLPGQIEVFPGSSGCSTAEISSQSRKIAFKRPQTGPPRPLKRQTHLGENRKITKMTVFGLVTPEMVFQARSKYFRVVLGVVQQEQAHNREKSPSRGLKQPPRGL